MKKIIYSKEFDITFVANPKVGSSTIKNTLLRGVRDGTVHACINNSADFTLPTFSNPCPFFALTRNPYSRVLSAYMEKIGTKKDNNIWPAFAKRYGVDINYEPSLYEFLLLLSEDRAPQNMDPHFRPQVYNLHVGDIEYSYLGRLEDMDSVAKYLKQHGLDLLTESPHRIFASDIYREVISKEEAELINIIYAADFEEFGYEMDLSSLVVPPPKVGTRKISKNLEYLFVAFELGLNETDIRGIFLDYRAKKKISQLNKIMRLARVLLAESFSLKKWIILVRFAL